LQNNNLPQDNFLGFIKTVSLNIIRDRWRKRKRNFSIVGFQEINDEKTVYNSKENDITQRLTLENAMSKLSKEQQTILDLRIVKGYSVAETAKLLGKTEGAIRTAQYRALQALAQILDDKGEDPSLRDRGREKIE